MTPATPEADSESTPVTLATLARWWKAIVAIVAATFVAATAYVQLVGRVEALEGVAARMLRVEKNVAFLVCQSDPTRCREAMTGIGE